MHEFLRRFYWRLPLSLRFAPMLVLDAGFAMAAGWEALDGNTWPPALWEAEANSHLNFLLPIVGGYMMFGAVVMVAGLMVSLSKRLNALNRAAVMAVISGLWFLWTAYFVSLLMSIHSVYDSGGVGGWSHVVLWGAESIFLGIVLMAAYFDPRYQFFGELSSKRAVPRSLVESR